MRFDHLSDSRLANTAPKPRGKLIKSCFPKTVALNHITLIAHDNDATFSTATAAAAAVARCTARDVNSRAEECQICH